MAGWLPSSQVHSTVMTRSPPPSSCPSPVAVEGAPAHAAPAASSCSVICAEPSPVLSIVIVWALPSVSVEVQLPKNDASAAGVVAGSVSGDDSTGTDALVVGEGVVVGVESTGSTGEESSRPATTTNVPINATTATPPTTPALSAR